MKLNLNERLEYGAETFEPKDSPFLVPQQVPKRVAERVVEKEKGSFTEDLEEEDEKGEEVEEVEGEEIFFPDEEEKKKTDFTVTVEESDLPLDEGVHVGRVKSLGKKEVKTTEGSTTDYLNLVISTSGEGGEKLEATASYPFRVTRRTMLGKLIKRFGHDLAVDQELPLEDLLVDKEIQFQVATDEEGYKNVLRDTIRPT